MSELASELRKLRLASPFSGDNDLLFASTNGRTIGHRNLTARGLDKAAARAALQGMTFHVLRHTFAKANFCREGVSRETLLWMS